jgi:hypothetical protein
MPKHVGALIIAYELHLLGPFVGGHTDCKNMEGTNNIQFTEHTIHSATHVPRPAAKGKCIARRSNGLAR